MGMGLIPMLALALMGAPVDAMRLQRAKAAALLNKTEQHELHEHAKSQPKAAIGVERDFQSEAGQQELETTSGYYVGFVLTYPWDNLGGERHTERVIFEVESKEDATACLNAMGEAGRDFTLPYGPIISLLSNTLDWAKAVEDEFEADDIEIVYVPEGKGGECDFVASLLDVTSPPEPLTRTKRETEEPPIARHWSATSSGVHIPKFGFQDPADEWLCMEAKSKAEMPPAWYQEYDEARVKKGYGPWCASSDYLGATPEGIEPAERIRERKDSLHSVWNTPPQVSGS